MIKLVTIPALTFDIDGYPPITVRRGSGLDLHVMHADAEFAPFVVHFKRHRVPVVDGWGFKQVTRWSWSVGWQHGHNNAHVTYIHMDGKPIDSYESCRIDALTMAAAWLSTDDKQRFVDQQWRRVYGLREAERLRRGIARVVDTFGLA